eukprot:snap_masked-scaffold_61-processed-gene-0.34-mRNA-1 protein AED:1.00 eAED:1.00 QI:0/0/0/0/1/1/2/0/91
MRKLLEEEFHKQFQHRKLAQVFGNWYQQFKGDVPRNMARVPDIKISSFVAGFNHRMYRVEDVPSLKFGKIRRYDAVLLDPPWSDGVFFIAF